MEARCPDSEMEQQTSSLPRLGIDSEVLEYVPESPVESATTSLPMRRSLNPAKKRLSFSYLSEEYRFSKTSDQLESMEVKATPCSLDHIRSDSQPEPDFMNLEDLSTSAAFAQSHSTPLQSGTVSLQSSVDNSDCCIDLTGKTSDCCIDLTGETSSQAKPPRQPSVQTSAGRGRQQKRKVFSQKIQGAWSPVYMQTCVQVHTHTETQAWIQDEETR